jgi:hypothetical protein
MSIFDKYRTEEKEITLDGETLIIRKLTNKERNEINSLMLKDTNAKALEKGEIQISIGRMAEVQLLAVSYALVKPKMTKKQLEELSSDSQEIITKIYEELEAWDKPKK